MSPRFEYVGHGPGQSEWFRCPWCGSVIVARTVSVGGPYRGGSPDQVAQVTLTATCEGCGRFTARLLPATRRPGTPVSEDEWQAALETMVAPDLENATTSGSGDDAGPGEPGNDE